MTGRRAWIVLGTAAMTVLGPSCGEPAPVPGALVASLVTPNLSDGAIVVTVHGPGISNVTAASAGHRVFWRATAADEVTVIVVGDLAAVPVFRLDVADVGMVATYHAVVTQVAARDDALRESVGGYEISFAAAGGVASISAP